MNRLGRSFVLLAALSILGSSQGALARPPKCKPPPPPPDEPTGGELLAPQKPLRRSLSEATTYLLYPGACVERSLGTWAPRSSPVADSLQPTSGFPNSSGYTDNQPDIAGNNNTIAYTRQDNSLSERLWHVVEATTPAAERPAILSGTRSLWCGKFDAGWTLKVGYSNHTYQILYIDTGEHAGSYNLTFEGNLSAELNHDFVYFVGGGSLGEADHADPLQNRRDFIDAIVDNGTGGPHGDSELLVAFTGSIQTSQSVVASGQTIEGAGSGQPSPVSYSINIGAQHRAIYVVFLSEDDASAEDGLWPEGKGQVLDVVSTSDNGSMYSDQAAAGGTDPYQGSIIKGTYGSAGFISARIPAGVGELWQLAPGTENVTSDVCALQKAFATDLFFEGGDPNTNLAINKQSNSIVSCTLPIPVGTASVVAQWSEYVDLPRLSGYVQRAQYRYHKGGGWSSWRNVSATNEVHVAASQAWTANAHELAEATQADSVQLRWNVHCIPAFSADLHNCSNSQSNALLYDNFLLRVTTGVPGPRFGIFPGSVAQTTFVDGQITGANCSDPPCWPGKRGSDLGTAASHNIAIHDNWNAPTGDTVTVALVTGLRRNGMGINWRKGFDKSIHAGEIGLPGSEFARTNAAYNDAHDVPRMIFRLFDPASKTWSPFDSTELIANAVVVSASPPETTLIYSEFNMNWPPYDKSIANASLPGGFTINGIGTYNGLRFLPRGSRIQYYWKAVDITGGVSYQFSSDLPAREVDDLPTLPGSSIKAPDIIEFRVLPGAYPSGPGGSLLAGRTDTPVLNLDGAYTTWSFGYDPVTQALRGLGVRADRYRHLVSGRTAHGFGGRELAGDRPDLQGNFFPNYAEYPLVDSLASWYRILIESGHTWTYSVFNEQDARVAEQWWRKDTGSNQGDRCIFLSGDDEFNALLNTTGIDSDDRVSLAQQVFGVSSAINAWSGTSSTPFPTIDDRFAAASAGPGLAAPSTFTYPVDGGCPGPNRFDALTKVGDADAVSAVFYPNAQVAGVARSREMDLVPDNDRNKAIGYGYSIQFIRTAGYGPTNANYARSGIENRMRVLYKFLTSCRAARTAGQTSQCWPCPSPGSTIALMQAEWSGQAAAFQTATYGPLYPIQAGALATAVEEPSPGSAPHVNALGQNRPNPFNPETTIPFSLAAPGRVVIRVFDIAGRIVRTLVDRVETVGPHAVRWNGKTDGGERAASGVYFYRITYPSGEATAKKLMILR